MAIFCFHSIDHYCRLGSCSGLFPFCRDPCGARVARRPPSIAAQAGPAIRVAVLVPAHNESAGLQGTLADIKGQLRSGDRLLVVADNCTDDTAVVARASGAEVTERQEPEKIGKGYALAWGLRQLDVDPPEAVIMVDADCRLAVGTIDQLAMACDLCPPTCSSAKHHDRTRIVSIAL